MRTSLWTKRTSHWVDVKQLPLQGERTVSIRCWEKGRPFGASGHCDKEMGRSALRRLRRALVNGVAIQPEIRQAEAAQRKALYENLAMVSHPDGNLIEIASYE